jgi:hypothetical protein
MPCIFYFVDIKGEIYLKGNDNMAQKFNVTTLYSMSLVAAATAFSAITGDKVTIEIRNGQLCFTSSKLATQQDYIDKWNQYHIPQIKGFSYREASGELFEPIIDFIVSSDAPIPDIKVIQRVKPACEPKTFAANHFVEMSIEELSGALSEMNGSPIAIDIYEDIVEFELSPFGGQINPEHCKQLMREKRGIEVLDFQGFRNNAGDPMVRILIQSDNVINITI